MRLRPWLILTVLVLPALAISLAPSVLGQGSGVAGERRWLIELRRQQLELREAQSHLERVRELADQGLVSQTELEQAEVGLRKAHIDYQEALLNLFAQQPKISVERAVKSQGEDGRKWVELTVVNLTPQFSLSHLRLLDDIQGGEPIPKSLTTRAVGDIFISLQDTGEPNLQGRTGERGTTIALPYEVHVPRLEYGERKSLSFQLLRDVSSVVAAISYHGFERELDIQLQQAETERSASLSSTQISQEVDLGSQATFDLRLERSTVDSASFYLQVLNLPAQISASFVDPETSARLSQINLPAGVTNKILNLRLSLPERAGGEVVIGQPVEFWAVVANSRAMQELLESRSYGAEEIQASRAGYVRLELIPRGVGKIEVNAPTLFTEIVRGDAAAVSLSIRNAGTRPLINVEVRAETPMDWRVQIEPRLIQALPVGDEREVTVEVEPPGDVPIGDYEVRIKTICYADNRPVPSEDKLYRLTVKGQPNIVMKASLSVLLLVLVGGMVFLGLRLTRR